MKLFLLLGTIIGFSANSAEHIFRHESKGLSATMTGESVKSVTRLENHTARSNFPYQYACSSFPQCVENSELGWTQIKRRNPEIEYNLNSDSKKFVMTGFDWKYDLTGVNTAKIPKTIDIYIDDGNGYKLATSVQGLRWSDKIISYDFEELIPANNIKFNFRSASSSYTAIQYFQPKGYYK